MPNQPPPFPTSPPPVDPPPLAPPAVSAPLAGPPPPPTGPPGPRIARIPWPQLSGAGWLATTGASMVLVAATIVVAGRWEAIGPVARFAGLVGSLLAIYFVAEAARRRVRTTATALAVLAACLTAPVGIAAAAALHGPWPVDITVGGLVALVATEAQSRRWRVRALKAATVVAAGLAATGAAALSGVPVALVGAGLAVVALVVGARRRSVALAFAVPFVPVLNALAEQGIGPGTLDRIGAIGPATPWVVPLSSTLAAAIIAISAHRRNSSPLAAGALAVFVWGCLVGLTAVPMPAAVWLSVPAAIVLAIEATAHASSRSIFVRWAERARVRSTPTLGFFGVLMPIIVALGAVTSDEFGDGSLVDFSLPIVFTALALTLIAFTTRLSTVVRPSAATSIMLDSRSADLVRLGAVGGSLSMLAAFGGPLSWMAMAALATWVLSSSITAWRSWIAVTGAHVAWALTGASLETSTTPLQFTIVVLVAAVMMVLACSWTTSYVAHAVGVPLSVMVATALIVIEWPTHFTVITFVLGAITVIATALAMTTPRLGPIDALAIAAGGAALLTSTGTTPAGISLAVLLMSAQMWLYGASQDRAAVAGMAAGSGVGSLVSLWWTTGTNDFVIDWLAPFGVTGQDLALGAVSLGMIMAGVALRATSRPSTWLAYSPGLGMAVAWLLMSQTDADGAWATISALVIAVIAIGIGGTRRQGAPLLIGTVAAVGTLVISAGPRLAAAPTWIWIAVGGVGLLVVASLVERSERPLLPLGDGRSDGGMKSIVEAFLDDFE